MSGNRRASQHSSRPSLHQHRRHSIDFSRWHFDIDAKLNRFLPRPPWHHLPRPVSHFFGYRGDEQPKTVGNIVIAYWSLIGAFCGVLLISEVSLHIPEFQNHHAPIIVGSFGAAAVLEFCAIESPFAQPRNAFFSQLIASTIGVCIAKLFALNPSAQAKPEIAGALSCAITTMLMVLTNTVHPPAGATALLAATELHEVGWWLIPIMLLGCSLMLTTALLLNNIQRRFPIYWWTPHPLGKNAKPRPHDIESVHEKKQESDSGSSVSGYMEPMQLVIRDGRVMVPDNLWVDADEREVLERICERMQE
ncbi:HPP family-domain-containing protein [Aspergillus pseudodeflectus]|uniref:HPP family-domain-containing protein n=1 Tax=Aspergillus pseudodeflectus TaxID=176178 RepID=A0ABR4KQQ0_9EURO